MIILGVDPGLTRCGVGVIEAGAHRRLSFIHVDVVRSAPRISPQDLRLLAIYNGLCSRKWTDSSPDAVSIERVFAQSNRNTVLGTATGRRPRHARRRATRIFPWRCIRLPKPSWLSPVTGKAAEDSGGAYGDHGILNLTKMPHSRRCRRCLGFGHLPCAAPGRRIAGRRTRTTSDRRATPVGCRPHRSSTRPQRHATRIEPMFCIMWMGRLDTISRTTCQFEVGAFDMPRYALQGVRAVVAHSAC